MDKLEGYAQFPNPIDSNEQRVKVQIDTLNRSAAKSRNQKEQHSMGRNSPRNYSLSKDPHRSYDTFEFYARLKENKRKADKEL